MNGESISCKCKTTTTSERHDNKEILEATGREKSTSTMVNNRQRLQAMKMGNRKSMKKRIQFRIQDVQWCWSHVRERLPSQEIDAPVSHTTTTKTTTYHDKASNRPPKWADNDRQHRQTKKDNQQSIKKRIQFAARGTRLCKFHRRSCSTGGAIDAQSFECSCP